MAAFRTSEPPRHGIAVALAVTALLLIGLEHHLGLHEGTRAVRYFSLLPVLAGAALLRPMSLGLLGVFVLSAQQLEGLLHPLLDNPEAGLRLFGRFLMITTCLWISSLRIGLKQKNQEIRMQLINSLRASALAHEIRQPLAVILLSSRKLLRSSEYQEAPDPASAADLERLHEAAEQLEATSRTMAALLRSARTEQRPVNLAAVVRNSLSTIEPLLASHRIQLEHKGTEDPLEVIGDAEQLSIACANLLRNAMEATESAAPSLRRLQVSLEGSVNQACLTVADSGPGLTCSLDELIHRASTKSNGMGMGLWIVQTIAQHHGGVLEAGGSQRLGGAELRFILPCRR